MGWFLYAPKICIIMSITSGILMGISVCTSLNDYYKSGKLYNLLPIACIILFLAIMAIKYKEMLATLCMFIFVGFSILQKHKNHSEKEN